MLRYLVPLGAVLTLHCLNTGKPFNEVEPNALPATVTWSSQVLPVLKQHCNECHSSGPESKYGTIGALDYSTYETAIPAVSATTTKDASQKGFQGILKESINSSSMPPGNKEKLNPYERALLLRWQEQGFLR